MRSQPMCAYCRRQPIDPAWRPFCSERCRMADLGRWLSGDYRVAGDPPPDTDPETPPDSPGSPPPAGPAGNDEL